jgi:type IV pilus assembly protein PilZ
MSDQTGQVLRLQYKDKAVLQQAHMSFCKDGGLYIPMPELPLMGSSIFMLVELPDSKQVFPACGTVVWVNNGRKKGVGVRLGVDEQSKFLSITMQTMLASSGKSSSATFTM